MFSDNLLVGRNRAIDRERLYEKTSMMSFLSTSQHFRKKAIENL